MISMSRLALIRRALALEVKLLAVEASLRWNSSRRERASRGPTVLDHLRSHHAQERRIENLSLRRDDLASALKLLLLAESPFFEI